MKKLTTKELVKQNEQALKILTTHTELRAWALQNGLDSAAGFSNFKKGLLEIGIDYEAIRSGITTEQRKELISSITHEVTLFTDAKASAGRYGICDVNGDPLWYGRFFDNDDAGEQSRAELCAAEKAVWLASKIAEAAGLKAIKLILKTDAQWLVYQDHSKQKGYVLTQKSKKLNIDLVVEWVPGVENPADKYTVCSGFQKWQDNNLASLPVLIEE